MDDPVLVVGCGSIGLRHIRNLGVSGARRVFAYDVRPERRAAARAAGAEEVADPGRLFESRPRAVLVCTPPTTHVELARQALTAGAHVLVEKPIAATLDGVDDLLALARARGLLVYVGYNLRFHAGLARLAASLRAGAIGEPLLIRAEFGYYLPAWRPGDHRETYSAQAALGGGVILDASHEIDYVRWLAGEIASVSAIVGRVGDLDIDVEDAALISLRFAGGMVGAIHLDYLQRSYTRTCKVVGTAGTLVWEWASGVKRYDAATDGWTHEAIVPDTNEMYVAEMRHFLACVAGTEEPVVTGADGRRVLEIALAAKRAAAERREIGI